MEKTKHVQCFSKAGGMKWKRFHTGGENRENRADFLQRLRKKACRKYRHIIDDRRTFICSEKFGLLIQPGMYGDTALPADGDEEGYGLFL